MTKILITGGAGFIGSHLCERLLLEGNHIICMDNLFTGSKDNISHLLANDHFQFIEYDIINPIKIEGSIDQIYNLACPASPEKYQIDPVYTLKVNFLGVLNLLELAKEKKAVIFLLNLI